MDFSYGYAEPPEERALAQDFPLPGQPPIPSSVQNFEEFNWDPPLPGAADGAGPRRRSYNGKTVQGIGLVGEIVEQEPWRRHTRVFGGAVCLACQESEERMRSMGLQN
jgi:hypothetical protein